MMEKYKQHFSRIILIDGNSLFFKSFYATYNNLKNNLSGTRNKQGMPINALRTFAHIIINLEKMKSNSKIIVAFDEQNTETFRTKHDFYKSHRKKQPDELYVQIPMVKNFLTLYGIKWMANRSYEADDIIGILSNKYKQNFDIEIITSDKDLLQLVDQNVKVFLSKSGISVIDEYNIDNFLEKANGLMPNQIPDLKGMMGDSSDNLKGAKGIGPITANNLLKKFNTIENIYLLLNEVESEKTKKALLEYKRNVILCKELATIISSSEEIYLNFDEIIGLQKSKPKIKDFFIENSIFNLIDKI